jgi:hypothetical protein
MKVETIGRAHIGELRKVMQSKGRAMVPTPMLVQLQKRGLVSRDDAAATLSPRSVMNGWNGFGRDE